MPPEVAIGSHPLEMLHPRSLRTRVRDLAALAESRLWVQILVALVLGSALGIALGPGSGLVAPETAAVLGEWIALPGTLFLAAVQMVIVPLVLASIVRGMASATDVDQLRQTGLGLMGYFLATTVFATSLGVALALWVRPGTRVDAEVLASLRSDGPEALDVSEAVGTEQAGGTGLGIEDVPDQIEALLPDNPLLAMVEGQMLQVVVFSAILGAALISLPPRSARPLLELLGSLQDVSMKIVSAVMRLAPLAVFGLLAQAMMRTGAGVLSGLAAYSATVVGGLALLLVVDVGIAAVLGGRSPRAFLAAIRPAQLMAFSTDSSAATLPVSLEAAVEGLGVRPSTANLVLPLGATVNMAGTACYHGLATVFMAQLYGIELSVGALVALLLTSLGSSIGAPATPGVGIMILATVLTSAGVPLDGLALVIGLDPLLERFRCVLNVSDDLVAATVLDRFIPQRHSLEVELAHQRGVEARRAEEETDVVIQPPPPHGPEGVVEAGPQG